MTIIGRRYYRIRKTIPKFTVKVHDYYYYCTGFLSGRGSFLYLVLRRRPPSPSCGGFGGCRGATVDGPFVPRLLRVGPVSSKTLYREPRQDARGCVAGKCRVG